MNPESRAQLRELKQDLDDKIISDSDYLELKEIILSSVKSISRSKNALPEPAAQPLKPSETSPAVLCVLCMQLHICIDIFC